MKKTTLYFLTLFFAIIFSVNVWGVMSVNAAETKLTLATYFAPKSNMELACEEFKRIIEEKTNGRIEITVYGAGSLYRPKGALSAIAKNMVNMTYLHTGMVARRSPILEFIGSFGAQGCWDSYEHYFRFIENPEVRKIATAEADKYYNSRILGFFAYGTGLVGSKRPVEKVTDLKGLKVRSSGTAQATIWRSLGAIPTELSAAEMYTALQRGTIDAVNTGTSRIRRNKLYEVAPYLTVDPTVPYVHFFFAINKNAWNKLSPDDQKLFEETARYMEKWTRKNAVKEREDDLAFLKEKVKKLIELSDSERTKLFLIVRPPMKELAKKQLGDKFDKLWGILESSK